MKMGDDIERKKKNIHVALIPDGNRRWAKRKKMPVWYGHMSGARAIENFVCWCADHPQIKTVSIYGLSTENLNRDGVEVDKLWEVFKKNFKRLLNSKKLKKRGVKVNIVGNRSTWRPDVKNLARDVMTNTKHYTSGVLNILVSYGSQFEIGDAIKKVAKKGVKKVPLGEKVLNQFLMVKDPVDLIIRTGGEHRLSNFLLYQAAYAEIYFSDMLWPDFNKKEFEKIMKWFNDKERRMGK
jgi:undecaprenyl diphosphate synthase